MPSRKPIPDTTSPEIQKQSILTQLASLKNEITAGFDEFSRVNGKSFLSGLDVINRLEKLFDQFESLLEQSRPLLDQKQSDQLAAELPSGKEFMDLKEKNKIFSLLHELRSLKTGLSMFNKAISDGVKLDQHQQERLASGIARIEAIKKELVALGYWDKKVLGESGLTAKLSNGVQGN